MHPPSVQTFLSRSFANLETRPASIPRNRIKEKEEEEERKKKKETPRVYLVYFHEESISIPIQSSLSESYDP